MENKFELKDVTMEHNEDNSHRYTLSFSDGEKQEFITLSGNGKLKETVKV